MTDADHAISYKLLAPGTPVHAEDGDQVGTVLRVLDNPREHIFDGIEIQTASGQRFVDAPEVDRITAARVSLRLAAGEIADLPERDPAGGPQFRADPRVGRIGRFFGGGWRRH